jgi:N-acetylmuramoyl-L-alanine amidase
LIRHSIAAISSALLLALAAVPAVADPPLTVTYQNQTIRFTHVSNQNGAVAVGVQDPGFAALLRATGAALTWKPGERYVMITTAVPVVASFSVGDRRYDVGTISLQAAFAPYLQGSEVYLPLDPILRSLDLQLRQDGDASILQPQLASLDVTSTGTHVNIVAHGGAPLRPRVSQTSGAVVYEFDGVGTTLAGSRVVNAGGVRTLVVAQTGSVRDPKTIVTAQLAPGASYQPPHSNDDRDVVLAFDGPTPAMPLAPSVAQVAPGGASPQPQSQAAAPPAVVTGVRVDQTNDGYTLGIAVTGDAAFEWHRLRDPDNRFWLDVKNAQLQGPPIEQDEPDPLASLRVRQVDAQTVRIALSLLGPKNIEVLPSTTGVAVDISRSDAPADVARSGTGSVGSVVSSNDQTVSLVTPAPIDETNGGGSEDANWKFGPREPLYIPTNPRLIVIDPGHGGSDRGAIRNGISEADVTLDISKRLRDVLIARGWQVQLTRDTDVDVYQPDDTAHEELQARVNVANQNGARLFVSIHANSFINSGPYGTTCYISKTSDWAFARLVEEQLANDGTKDDGIIKSHLYVTLHTRMPAVLVETAFLSNPSDFSLLTSSAWRAKVAREIADGIDQYNQSYPVPNQPAQ